jgi:pyruvate dehydrogenase E1 component beta subunit
MKFTDAILSATEFLLENYPEAYVIGLGVSYKNGADGTMGDLKERYSSRVIDTPVSESAITGAAFGSAISGMKPIVHHGRLEFAMLAYDQIITQSSNWNYMFGGDYGAPITYRIAIGRQWGNGPQHTKAMYSMFGNVPGLKVVVPSTPEMAKQLLLSAVLDPNPVVFLEPRWLYKISGHVSEGYHAVPLNKGRTILQGSDLTLVSFGDGINPCYEAALLLREIGISADVIDLVSLNPIDYDLIIESLRLTRNLMTFETGTLSFGVGREIIGALHSDLKVNFHFKSTVISAPNVPCPTATSLTESYYPSVNSILRETERIFDKKIEPKNLEFRDIHLAPEYNCLYE